MTALDDLAMGFHGRLLTAPVDVAPFLTDWRGQWVGKARAVAQPESVAEVARVMRWCAENGAPVVAQGGNTGLSGGATPDRSGSAVVLSLARLSTIRRIDTVNDTMTVDAGCILQNVQEAARANDRLFPLRLAAEGSCTVGGNLATNAGGCGVLRYGNARDLCLGIEVVTAAGEIWDGLSGLRKNNSGYDLRDLFIGSEGTLGIITGAVFKLFPQASGRAVAFVAVASPVDALALLGLAKGALDTALTAFELMSDSCLSLVLEHSAELRSPFAARSPWYVLVEVVDLLSDEAAIEVMESVLSDAIRGGLIGDAVIAVSLAQSQALWALREDIAAAQGAAGMAIKHDIALPLSALATFLVECDAVVTSRWPDMRFITFGHLGDGNLHYNFSPAAGGDQTEFIARQNALNGIVHDLVRAHGGSISAEHGLGMLRRDEAARFRSPVETRLMRAVKSAFDPLGIMNPGKLLPAPHSEG